MGRVGHKGPEGQYLCLVSRSRVAGTTCETGASTKILDFRTEVMNFNALLTCTPSPREFQNCSKMTSFRKEREIVTFYEFLLILYYYLDLGYTSYHSRNCRLIMIRESSEAAHRCIP